MSTKKETPVGVVIGTNGFGYYRCHRKYCKAPHFGGVEIGEEVEIGANTCIDRGTMTCKDTAKRSKSIWRERRLQS